MITHFSGGFDHVLLNVAKYDIFLKAVTPFECPNALRKYNTGVPASHLR